MQASTNEGSFSLAQQKTDVSHAECRNAREWEIDLQTQDKSLLRAHLRFNGITLALYECITFKNIAKIDL